MEILLKLVSDVIHPPISMLPTTNLNEFFQSFKKQSLIFMLFDLLLSIKGNQIELSYFAQWKVLCAHL